MPATFMKRPRQAGMLGQLVSPQLYRLHWQVPHDATALCVCLTSNDDMHVDLVQHCCKVG